MTVYKVIWHFRDHPQLTTRYFLNKEAAESFSAAITAEMIDKQIPKNDPHSEYPYIREVNVIE